MTQSFNAEFADGKYDFYLGLEELQQLQIETAKGAVAVLEDFKSGLWSVEHISTVLRLALIGGGQDVAKARSLVEFYVEQKSRYIPNVHLAYYILQRALMGESEIQDENLDAEIKEVNDFLEKKQAAGVPQLRVCIANLRLKDGFPSQDSLAAQ